MWEKLIEWALGKVDRVGRWIGRKLPRGVTTLIDDTLDRRYLENLKQAMDAHLRGVRIENVESDYISRRVRSDSGDGESYDLTELIRSRRSLVLRANAGWGKTTACYVLARELAMNQKRGGPIAPVLIECRKLASMLSRDIEDRQLPRELPAISAAIREYLLSEMDKPFEDPKVRSESTDQLRQFMESSQLVLIVEGLDELVSAVPLEKPLIAIFVDVLDRLAIELRPAPLTLMITSRPNEAEFLAPLRLPSYGLEPINEKRIEEFIETTTPEFATDGKELSRIFVGELAARPLYLRPLLQHWPKLRDEMSGDPTAQIDYMWLLRQEVSLQINDNKDRCSLDRDGQLQQACMRRLAVLSSRPLELTHEHLVDSAHSVAVLALDENARKAASQLIQVLPLFLRLRFIDKVYEFPHADFRDFWLAQGIVNALLDGFDAGEMTSHISLSDMLNSERLLHVVCDMVRAQDLASRERVTKKLVETINQASNQRPASRRVPTEAAGALSLLVRINDVGLVEGLDCRGVCLQGFQGAGQRIENVDFRDAVLWDSDLRGAALVECNFSGTDFDNCDMHGTDLSRSNLTSASFKNTGMGGLPQPDTKVRLPTRLLDVKLTDSNWFNFRITFGGYFQFWTGKVDANAHLVFLATSRGELWAFDYEAENLTPRIVQTNHEADLMDMDFSPSQPLIATASRDLTVRIFDASSIGEIREVARFEKFHQPPRNVAFSVSGRWLCATDRNNNVLFFKASEGGALNLIDYKSYTDHCGPVLCLEPARKGSRDVFYTAGYDGVVLEYTEALDGAEPWVAKEIAAFHLEEKPDQPDTIRVLAKWPPQPDQQLRGIWIGGEACVLYYHSFANQGDAAEAFRFRAEIFRLAISPSSRRIVVGLADGSIEVMDVDESKDQVTLKHSDTVVMQKRDIVRFVHFLDEDRLLCASWAGAVRIWDFQEQRFVKEYEFPCEHWRPQLDRDTIQISPPEQIDTIANLSGTFKEYLKALMDNA